MWWESDGTGACSTSLWGPSFWYSWEREQLRCSNWDIYVAAKWLSLTRAPHCAGSSGWLGRIWRNKLKRLSEIYHIKHPYCNYIQFTVCTIKIICIRNRTVDCRCWYGRKECFSIVVCGSRWCTWWCHWGYLYNSCLSPRAQSRTQHEFSELEHQSHGDPWSMPYLRVPLCMWGLLTNCTSGGLLLCPTHHIYQPLANAAGFSCVALSTATSTTSVPTPAAPPAPVADICTDIRTIL